MATPPTFTVGQVLTAAQMNLISSLLCPTGVISAFAGSSAPTNWLLCDGSAVSRTTYADLFSLFGTTYGSGDGSTTFNLPNLKGRIPVGRDSSQTEFDTLGESGGSKTHTLTTSEMPSHSHTQRSGASLNVTGGANSGLAYDHFGSTINSNMVTADTGGGQAHNNLQPYLVVNYIVKT